MNDQLDRKNLPNENKDDKKSTVLISTRDEIEKLSEDLADSYVEYFTIDTSQQKHKVDDSIEECLTHLEEVSSVLDNYRQNSSNIATIFIEKLASKDESLNKLYTQVDALEQYIFRTNKLLDQLENSIKELEIGKGSKGFKIIEMISRFSLNNLPRFSLLSNLSGMLEDTSATSSLQRASNVENSTISINEILDRVESIQDSLAKETSNLNTRLYGSEGGNSTKPQQDEPMLGCNLPEQIDGSWQELL